MKNLSNLNLILLFILSVLSITFIIRLLKKNYNQNNNNLNRGIENSIDRLLGIKEGFQTTQRGYEYNSNNQKTEETAQQEIEKELETSTSSPPDDDDDGVGDSIDSLDENDGKDTSTLDTMFEGLQNLEQKCIKYEKSQQENDDNEKKRNEEYIQEQLDIENVKINELTEIVNFYRKKYHEKMSVNSQCRKNKFDSLEKSMSKMVETNENSDTKGSVNQQEVHLKINDNPTTTTSSEHNN